MNTEWKLVPVEPNREMCLAARQASAEHPIADQADSPVIAYRAMLAAAPAPPAGGEVEVLATLTEIANRDTAKSVTVRSDDLREALAHVTRLQSEVDQWKSVANDFAERRDELKRELDMRDGQRDTLQSELTKAWELLADPNTSVEDVQRFLYPELYPQSAPASKDGE